MGLWKEINKEDSLIRNNIGFLVDNGRRVKFWWDTWCNGEALRNTFPSLYSLDDLKDACVVEV